ncbi:MAG: S-layer homology domain-containing protein [Lachnospiraceae bacterium]|nr:S-layer homology domain-containing protein [Lachnospiraceae bacterium]
MRKKMKAGHIIKRKQKKIRNILFGVIVIVLFAMSPVINVRAETGDNSEITTEGVLEAGTSYKVGDIIKFGHYEQDGNLENGKEEIEWQVLKVESDRVLVVSKYALDCKKYDETKYAVTWEESTLRKWLNDDFLNEAFTMEEQEKIPIVYLENRSNPYWGTAGGYNTNDRIFCLSLDEMESCFGDYSFYGDSMWGCNQNLICDVTQYAINNGAKSFIMTEEKYNETYKQKGYTSSIIGQRGCYWWLRSSGFRNTTACYVDYFGEGGASIEGISYADSIAVRPALYINRPTIIPQSISLNQSSAIMYYCENLTLNAVLAPSDANKRVTWYVDNPKIARVDNGVVKTNGVPGTVIVTGRTINGLTASCRITVLEGFNPSNSFKGVIIDENNFQDEQFRNFLLNGEDINWDGIISSDERPDSNGDGKLSQEELANVKDYAFGTYVDTYGARCEELYYFSSLEFIAISDDTNRWWNLDLSRFPKIKSLLLLDSVITDVDSYIGKCPDLEYVQVEKTSDTLIDFSKNTKLRKISAFSNRSLSDVVLNNIGLESIEIENNILCNLDISNCPSLVSGRLNRNKLTELDISKNKNLSELSLLGNNIQLLDLREHKAFSDIYNKKEYVYEYTYDDENIEAITYSDKDFKYSLTVDKKTTILAAENNVDEFADIKSGTWQYKVAKAVYDKGYMTGKGTVDGRIIFSPNTNITRSEFVVSLYSMAGKPDITYRQQFSDVKEKDWFAKQVTWASDNGIVAGNPDGSFGISGNATREQLALMFYKYAKSMKYDVSVKSSATLDGFTDAGKVSSWALTAVKWAVERGIISGKGSAEKGYRIDPGQGATRAECAAMMNKFDEVYSGGLKTVDEQLEEPLELPMEDIEEDVLIPGDEIEDAVDEEDSNPEEEIEDIIDDDAKPGEDMEDVQPGDEIEEGVDNENASFDEEVKETDNLM